MYDPGINKTIRWTLYTAGGIFALVGIFAALHPAFAISAISTLVGVGLLISSANHVVPYFSLKNSPLRPRWLLASAVVDAIYGVVFVSPLGGKFFATFVGLWILFFACARVYMAYVNWVLRASKWWTTPACCVVMLIVAVFLLVNPNIWMIFTGAALIGVGVLTIIEGRLLYPSR
ncbi:MAG: DUF308 domain-containing protein [Synergistaceae bacterium]|jgi:uncharacterized membrane protein HdeD (DUF308 family)|nr:DUF308 domain-containing protein [Synergistaceae bacterium]